MKKHFNDINLAVRDPDSLKHLENQLNRLSSQVANTDMTRNEEACKEFFDLITGFKEDYREHFSGETWKKVDQDLDNLMEHRESQIAQGIINNLRHEIMEGR